MSLTETTVNLIEKLNWRYAVKKFDAEKKLSDEQVETLLEALRLTPSSFGLQAWKFVVVKNPEIRQSLVEHSWNQQQVADASHLIVLCRQSTIDAGDVDRFIAEIAETRNLPVEALGEYSEMMKGFVGNFDEATASAWMTKQLYIALGNLLTSAAVLGIDACPMEGFNPVAYDEILGLEEKGLNSVLVVPVGYRAEDDAYAGLKKVRRATEDVIIEI
ncbi:NAD(P)H-dependent oxidoreductase [Fulvitalea axinellae]|uniref:NAD(P)H-dependent oxidoreductase n=1 Tax=Fulvitalea axinellae TaxID=1182444 RepID=A0AAU9DBV0_9BACT|nr:NAD(P)H-dependent oxidoreductase [Fulvitalea axinellae]